MLNVSHQHTSYSFFFTNIRHTSAWGEKSFKWFILKHIHCEFVMDVMEWKKERLRKMGQMLPPEYIFSSSFLELFLSFTLLLLLLLLRLLTHAWRTSHRKKWCSISMSDVWISRPFNKLVNHKAKVIFNINFYMLNLCRRMARHAAHAWIKKYQNCG